MSKAPATQDEVKDPAAGTPPPPDAGTPPPPDAGTPPADPPKTKTVELVDLVSVYGPMNHPYTHANFNIGPATSHVIDDWVKTQMDAGKIKFA